MNDLRAVEKQSTRPGLWSERCRTWGLRGAPWCMTATGGSPGPPLPSASSQPLVPGAAALAARVNIAVRAVGVLLTSCSYIMAVL